ncbi:MAG: SufD family Fe-S cluster assembly protein, partial [Oricola sp.]|nr:SufD family Fe-S cluster assembly protein [Oricola sp.]
FYSTLFHMSLGEGATLDRAVLQESGPQSVTHAFFGVLVSRGAHLKQTGLSTGGRLCRHETFALVPNEAATVDIASASLVSGERHADFTSLVRFAGEGTTARQLHKGVARDRARNVFQGKFHVLREAQKTDAKMTANALLLSDGAEANHKPELEIYADDVECAHGSTVGALDDDALFYLRQRGLSEQQARALLVQAFVGEAMESIEDDAARAVFAARVNGWLEENE